MSTDPRHCERTWSQSHPVAKTFPEAPSHPIYLCTMKPLTVVLWAIQLFLGAKTLAQPSGDAAKPESFGFSTNLRPGDEAVATCLLRKTSPAQTAKLAWLRDGRPVTTSADRRVVVIKASQNSLTLAINDVLVEDVGNYSCVADSAAGHFETTVPLLLHGERRMPPPMSDSRQFLSRLPSPVPYQEFYLLGGL
ncbi:hypothetical protein MRX96_005908 [Rhipicephalus microplus]